MEQKIDFVDNKYVVTVTASLEEVQALQKANKKFCLKEIIGAAILIRLIDIELPEKVLL